MITIRDYEMENGRIDWDAYRKAAEDAGEQCYQCGALIINLGFLSLRKERVVGRQKCFSCKQLENELEESVTHDTLVRCPKCGHHEDAVGDDNYALYEDGEHDFMCSKCEHDYTVITHVSYEYESPIREGGDGN